MSAFRLMLLDTSTATLVFLGATFVSAALFVGYLIGLGLYHRVKRYQMSSAHRRQAEAGHDRNGR
jgi:hypothetical protein